MEDVSRYCRFCLEDLHEAKEKSVYQIQGDLDILVNKMQAVLNLNLSFVGGAPKQACLNCVSLLEFSLSFLHKLRRIEELYQQGCDLEDIIKEICNKPEELHKQIRLRNQPEDEGRDNFERDKSGQNVKDKCEPSAEMNLVALEKDTNGKAKADGERPAEQKVLQESLPASSVDQLPPNFPKPKSDLQPEREEFPWQLSKRPKEKKMRQILPKTEVMPLDPSNIKSSLLSIQGSSPNQVMIPVTLKTVCSLCRKTVVASSMAEFKKHSCQQYLECEINDCRKKFFGKHSLKKHQRTAHYQRKPTGGDNITRLDKSAGRILEYKVNPLDTPNNLLDHQIQTSVIGEQLVSQPSKSDVFPIGEHLISISPRSATNGEHVNQQLCQSKEQLFPGDGQLSQAVGPPSDKGEKIVLETMVSVQPAPVSQLALLPSPPTPAGHAFPTSAGQQSVIYLQTIGSQIPTGISVSPGSYTLVNSRTLEGDKGSQPQLSVPGEAGTGGTQMYQKPIQLNTSPSLEIMKYRPVEHHQQLHLTTDPKVLDIRLGNQSDNSFTAVKTASINPTCSPVPSLKKEEGKSGFIPLIRTFPSSQSSVLVTSTWSPVSTGQSLGEFNSSCSQSIATTYTSSCDTPSLHAGRPEGDSNASNRELDIVEKCMQQIQGDEPGVDSSNYPPSSVYQTQIQPAKYSQDSSHPKEDTFSGEPDYDGRLHVPFLMEKSSDNQLTVLEPGMSSQQLAVQSTRYLSQTTKAVERPFKCEYAGCTRSYYKKSILSIHVRSHTGERPFACENCGRSFSRILDKKKHKLLQVCCRSK